VSDDALDSAKAAAEAARARLFATAQEIQGRLEPQTLLDEAVGTVREQSAKLARTAGDTARERPGMVGAAAAAGALLVLRKPLMRLGKRLFGRRKREDDETEDDAAG
jgi:hypothetical protein